MKKFATITLLLTAVLMSFSAVLADELTDFVDMIRTEVAATVIAEIQQTLESEEIQVIIRNQTTPTPQINTGYIYVPYKPTVNPLATNGTSQRPSFRPGLLSGQFRRSVCACL